MKALIDGNTVQFRHRGYPDQDWIDLHANIHTIRVLLSSNNEFIRKAEMITIGDVVFPKPYSGIMETSQTYYFPSLGSLNLCGNAAWIGDRYDVTRLARGQVHLDEENAIAHAKALIKLSGGCVE